MDNAVQMLVQEAVKKSRYKWALISLVVSLMVVFIYAFSISSLFAGGESMDEPHVAIVRVAGPIMEDKDASARLIIQNMRDAMSNQKSVGMILSINSPGGSPIQAERIYDEINKLVASHKDKKIVAVINELGASAAYYVASAAPTIYASKASLVGSIGVTGSGFGFTSVMDKLGVERRVYASGEHKLFLDPFSAQNEEEANFFKGVLGRVHAEFIDRVRLGRGERLKEELAPGMFSGLIWDGGTAKDLGLIDSIGTIDTVLEKEFSQQKIFVYEQPVPLLKSIGSIIGASIYQSIGEELFNGGVKM